MERKTIAVVVDYGEREFRSWDELLGEPSARYFRAKDGAEFARQWNVRRERNARLFLRLRRQLADAGAVGDDVVELLPPRAVRQAA